MKNIIILILLVANGISIKIAMDFRSDAIAQKAGWDTETVLRLEKEDKMNELLQEKSTLLQENSTLQASLKAKEDKIQEGLTMLESAKNALVQEQLVSQNLKEEIQKISKLKEALEENLQAMTVEMQKKEENNTKKQYKKNR